MFNWHFVLIAGKMHNAIKRVATSLGKSKSDIVREALTEYLEKHPETETKNNELKEHYKSKPRIRIEPYYEEEENYNHYKETEKNVISNIYMYVLNIFNKFNINLSVNIAITTSITIALSLYIILKYWPHPSNKINRPTPSDNIGEQSQSVAMSEGPTQPAEKIDGEWQVNQAVCQDDKGHEVQLAYYVMNRGYAWDYKKTDVIVDKDGNEITSIQFQENFMTSKMIAILKTSSDVVALGYASDEGENKFESNRALLRAKTLRNWIASSIRPHRFSAKALSIGQHKGPCNGCDAPGMKAYLQRPVVFIAILKKDPGTSVKEAVENFLEDPEPYTINESDSLPPPMSNYYPENKAWSD